MSRADEFYGAGMDRMFPEGAPQSPSPWPSAPRTRTHAAINLRAIGEAVSHPERHEVQDLDPRRLHTMQSGLGRAGVDYYLHDPAYRETGQTFADAHDAGNRTPVVFHDDASGRDIISSGNHRAAAALLSGGQFRALVVHGEPATHADNAAYQREIIERNRRNRQR